MNQTNQTALQVKTYDTAKRKYVLAGTILGNTYNRSVGYKHKMIKENGYGIQVDVLEYLIKKKVHNIDILTRTGTHLKSHLADWVNKGKKKDYGHGAQIFLDIKFMREN